MDFKTKKQDIHSAKFFYSGTQGAFVVLTTVTEERLIELRDECRETLVEYPEHPKTGLMQRVESKVFDDDLFFENILDETILEWGGWSVDGGAELECNADNKTMLIKTFDDFAKFYTKSTKKLTTEFKKKYGSKSVKKTSKSTRRTTSKSRTVKDAK